MTLYASCERIAAIVGATAICVVALCVDGLTALTLSLGVAATLAGTTGYIAGLVRGRK